MSCIFCRIIQGELPASLLYEDEQVVAFPDLHPQAPFHALIIPKQHIATLNDLKTEHEALIGHMILTAQKIAKDKGYHEKGFRLNFNCNSEGGQTVFHIHLHLLAGRQMHWPPG